MAKPVVILCLDNYYAMQVKKLLPPERFDVLVANTANPRAKVKSAYFDADSELALQMLDEHKGRDGFIISDAGCRNFHVPGTTLTSIANFGQHGTWHTMLVTGTHKPHIAHLADAYMSWGKEQRGKETILHKVVEFIERRSNPDGTVKPKGASYGSALEDAFAAEGPMMHAAALEEVRQREQKGDEPEGATELFVQRLKSQGHRVYDGHAGEIAAVRTCVQALDRDRFL